MKLGLLTDIDMLLIIEKGIRCGIYYAIHRYVKVNNKYTKDYNKNKEASYLMYWDANNRCEADAEYPKNSYSGPQILPVKMKITKCQKLVFNLYNEEKYVEHIRTLK